MLINLDFRDDVEFNKEDKFTTRVRLFTGYKCNYDCSFCFYKGQTPQPFHQGIRRQASIAKINCIDSFDLSGGEPTIIPDWFDTLIYLRDSGFVNIAAITNGSTFENVKFLNRSIDCGMTEALFSYHGPSAEVHDFMTKEPGSYKRLYNSISNVVDTGITLRIITVVTKDNYKYLPMIAKDMLDIQPDCFNFLPFRLENQATSDNMLQYSDSVKYIKEAIDILSSINTFISVRYIPFCVMTGYEKYVSGWIQKLFDPYEWSQHTFECLEHIRLGRPIPRNCLISDKSKPDLEFAATYHAINATSGFSIACMNCSHKFICEGIWKTYAKFYKTDEFMPIEGDDIRDVLHHRRKYMNLFKKV